MRSTLEFAIRRVGRNWTCRVSVSWKTQRLEAAAGWTLTHAQIWISDSRGIKWARWIRNSTEKRQAMAKSVVARPRDEPEKNAVWMPHLFECRVMWPTLNFNGSSSRTGTIQRTNPVNIIYWLLTTGPYKKSIVSGRLLKHNATWWISNEKAFSSLASISVGQTQKRLLFEIREQTTVAST